MTVNSGGPGGTGQDGPDGEGLVQGRIWREGLPTGDPVTLADVPTLREEPETLFWLDLLTPSAEQMADLARSLHLTEDAVEDAIARGERPKVARHHGYGFITAYSTAFATEHAVDLDPQDPRMELHRISVFVLGNGIVTVRAAGGSEIDEIVDRWQDEPDTVLLGPTGLVHGLLDTLVDGYLDTAARLEELLEELEDMLFDEAVATREVQELAFRLRKELLLFRRVVAPMREVVAAVMRGRIDEVVASRAPGAYEDLNDHVLRASEWAEALREGVHGVFETNLALDNARMNEVMKKLTGWAAIIAVPTAITGWFGMNVPYLGSEQMLGLIIAIVLIIGLAGSLYTIFKRKEWI